MIIATFSFIVFGISILAGFLGALTGLGGGVVIIPALVLLLHVDIHYAMGASIISVMATSTGSAIAFLRQGYTNLRIGIFLETAAVIGAIVGALIVKYMPVSLIEIVFGVILIMTALLTIQRKDIQDAKTSHPWADHLHLNASYPSKNGNITYKVERVPAALGLMGVAGSLSGLLGIGSGTLKVLVMDQMMRLPYKVATSTSNFIIGITAAVSAGIYFSRGYINPIITFPVMIGVVLGAIIGARVMHHIHNRILRIVFSIIICFLAFLLIYKGLILRT
ncbi:MAG: sulfite exporter TauE/SafE family protein [Gammaproteobacteria bacterium]